LDAVLSELLRMTTDDWILVLVTGCGLALVVAWFIQPAKQQSPTRRLSPRHPHHRRVRSK
jgi:hypothetical protein